MQWVSTFASGAEGGAPVYFACRYTGELSIKAFPQATLGNPSPSGYDVRRIAGMSSQWYSERLGLIFRRCGLLYGFVHGALKGEMMGNNRAWFCEYKIHNRGDRLSMLWPLRCLALLVLVALGCVSAAAQSTVYVPTHKSNSVAVIDTVLDRVVAIVPVQFQPLAVALTPNGAFAYVTNQSSDNVSVISTATNTVVATVPVVSGSYNSGPYAVAITPNGAFAYTANAAASTVSVINTATNTVIATIPVGTVPHGVAITPDGAFAYVGNEYSNTVSVIDTATNTLVDTVQGVAVAPEGVAIMHSRNALTFNCR